MKKILRPILCGGVLAALLCTPSLAAEQGDFSLLVNGEPVTFTDAAPVLKDGRSFLPAVTTFQALGFAQEDIVWDGETQTVTASKDGAAISLTVGDSAVTWTGPSWSQTSEDGTSGSAGGSGGIAYLDTAPYIDPATNRTYIPVGLVADILGCRVAWDGETSTVIIDDVDAILAENTETYELMDQYLDYARKYSQGNYQVEGSYLLTSAPGEMESGVEIIHTVGGDYSLISSQTAMQLDLGVSIGGTIMGAPISPTDMDLDLRADLDTGMLYLYFQSEDLEQLMNNNVQVNGETIEFQIPDQWYSLDMKAVYDEAYGPGFYEELIALSAVSQEAAFAQTLEELLKSDTLILTSTATTSDYLEALNQLLGDSQLPPVHRRRPGERLRHGADLRRPRGPDDHDHGDEGGRHEPPPGNGRHDHGDGRRLSSLQRRPRNRAPRRGHRGGPDGRPHRRHCPRSGTRSRLILL